jgi:hypothetical protein
MRRIGILGVLVVGGALTFLCAAFGICVVRGTRCPGTVSEQALTIHARNAVNDIVSR